MNQDTSCTLTISRAFAAPRVRAFDAWTNPDSDIDWWSPRNFTLLFNKKEEDAEGKLEPPPDAGDGHSR